MKKIVLLPGDGIGPEVTREAVKVLAAAGTRAGLRFDFEERLIGGACLDARDVPVEEETLEACRAADAVFLGAVGGPQWDNRGPAGRVRLIAGTGNFKPETSRGRNWSTN